MDIRTSELDLAASSPKFWCVLKSMSAAYENNRPEKAPRLLELFIALE